MQWNYSDSAVGTSNIPLRYVSEIDPHFRHFFSTKFSQFNFTQSTAFDDAYNSDVDLVISAPTGAGKTVIFELALIRVLMRIHQGDGSANQKAVYMSPTRALCDERHRDWTPHLAQVNINCMLLTGDIAGDYADVLRKVEQSQVIITTPEKWDSMTRRWRDADHTLMKGVRLFMIDEVHLLGEDERGATLEIIVSRMKTIRSHFDNCSKGERTPRHANAAQPLRFVAVSATVPNIIDVATWIGSKNGPGDVGPAKYHVIDPNKRPVKLTYIVKSFKWTGNNLYRFDLSLNYKLPTFIHDYSNGQPTLIFCSTRTSTEQCAVTLSSTLRIHLSPAQRRYLSSFSFQQEKLQTVVNQGIGFHHAALIDTDRQTVEMLFRCGHLPVLVSTSTLAMGVNLPAHLVIIKSTVQLFASGNSGGQKQTANTRFTPAQASQEYSITQIQQMLGRAGRPQFDKDGAVALILTRDTTEERYRQMLHHGNFIESVLHRHMTEHVNAEIVLKTFSTLPMMLTWLKSTFFYVRLRQNPQFYNFDRVPSSEHTQQHDVDEYLEGLCREYLEKLATAGVIDMDLKNDGKSMRFLSNSQGTIMARHYVRLDTMRLLIELDGSFSLQRLLDVVSKAREFDDVRLRHTEKGVLNALNYVSPPKKGAPKTVVANSAKTVRYPVPGKVQQTSQKANLLIQATLGCLGSDEGGHKKVLEVTLKQDVGKIFRSLERIGPCLVASLRQRCQNVNTNTADNDDGMKMYRTLVSACLLAKCVRAKLWENSPHKMRQLPGIGEKLSARLIEHGLTEYKKIIEANPRNLEVALMKKPPFGDQLKAKVQRLPHYSLAVQRRTPTDPTLIEISLKLTNWADVRGGATDSQHRWNAMDFVNIIAGDTDNRLYCCERLSNNNLIAIHQAANDAENCYKRLIRLQRTKLSASFILSVHVISERWVGVDKCIQYSPIKQLATNLSQQYSGDITDATLPASTCVQKPATIKPAQKRACDDNGGSSSNNITRTPSKRGRGGAAAVRGGRISTPAKPTALAQLLEGDKMGAVDDDDVQEISMDVDPQLLDWLADVDFESKSNGQIDEIVQPPANAKVVGEKQTVHLDELDVAIGDSGDDDDAEDSYEQRAAAADKIDVFRPHLDELLQRFNLI